MRGRGLSERTMRHAKSDMLTDNYLGDMRRRGCTDDHVTTIQRALPRSGLRTAKGSEPVALTDIWGDVVEAFHPRLHGQPPMAARCPR